jgi:serine/threonine protein kinase
LVEGERVELAVGTRLGGGQQGEVLQVSDEQWSNCCLKITRKPSEFERELAVLRALQGVPGVVLYKGCNVDDNIIMMSPVHKKTLQHYKGDAACLTIAWRQLVAVFEAVHERGYAYRDFRGSNILVEQIESRFGFKCKVHLTDFGTTVRLGEPHPYEGTLRHGAGSVLSSLAMHGRLHPVVCSRETELESLVKMVHILENKGSTSLDGINPVAGDACEKLRVWWEEAENDMDDRRMSRLQSARIANYAALRNI